MNRAYGKEIIEDDVTRIVRQAFGIDEDKLLRDFLLAQTEIGDDQIPPESEDGFDRLLGKMKERNIQPRYLRNHSEMAFTTINGTAAVRRPRRLKSMARLAVVAAALMTMVLGMSITTRARKWYAYNVLDREVSGADMTYNKATLLEPGDALENAYQQIQDELGIDVLRLSYIPEGMIFEKVTSNKNSATLVFEYQENTVYIVQQQGVNGSSNNFTSDRQVYSTIHNTLLDKEIVIQTNQLIDGEREFHVEFTAKDNYYLLEGVMDYTEFEQIIEGIYINY